MHDSSNDSGPLDPGDRIAGRYEILESIGKGGFGRVYRAHDHEIDEQVALKFLDATSDTTDDVVSRVRNEIRLARRISHPNVIRLHDVGESEGLRFISMEFVRGESLGRVLARRGRIPVGDAIRIFEQLAEGVGAAHHKGVVHRDLKPGNVIIDGAGHVKVLDFGLAAIAGREKSISAGLLMGTPHYVAPEQAEGRECTRRTDLYALGVILFEMLTGRLPFDEPTSRETVLARLRHRAPDPCDLNPSLPRWLGDLVLRCLEREQRDRPASVDRLLDEIRHSVSEEEDRPTETLALPRSAWWRLARHRRLWTRVGPAALVVAGLVLAVPAIREALRTDRSAPVPLFEDGEVRLVVMDFERINEDGVTRMVAAGLSEALRLKIGRRQDVRLLDVSGMPPDATVDSLRNLKVEHVMSGRVGRIGDEIRILVSVTAVPGRERWMSFERSLRWEESWEGIDALVSRIADEYFAGLNEERSP